MPLAGGAVCAIAPTFAVRGERASPKLLKRVARGSSDLGMLACVAADGTVTGFVRPGGTMRRLVVLVVLVLSGLALWRCSGDGRRWVPARRRAGRRCRVHARPGGPTGARGAAGPGIVGVQRLRRPQHVEGHRPTRDDRCRPGGQGERLSPARADRRPGEDCDADGGELSAALVVAVTRDDQPTAPLWSGRFRDLADGVELTDCPPGRGDLAPARHSRRCHVTRAPRPMSDVATFGMRLEWGVGGGVRRGGGSRREPRR